MKKVIVYSLVAVMAVAAPVIVATNVQANEGSTIDDD